MPRYFFHYTDGRRTCADADGLELPDDAAALKEAKLMARDLWSEPSDGAWRIQVSDTIGRQVTALDATPPPKALKLVYALDDWLKRICRHPDAAVSSSPPSVARRAPGDPQGWLREKILRSHAADRHETPDRA